MTRLPHIVRSSIRTLARRAEATRLNLPAIATLVMLCSTLSVSGTEIRGRVFVDRNGDGVADNTEMGLAGVAVSDGRTVVVTAADGSYAIAADGVPFVFVSLPRGYRTEERFFANITGEHPIDFALIEWPESAGNVARFVQISDTHVDGSPDSVHTFREDLAEIDAVEPRPGFVLATGDLVDAGAEGAQFEGYLAGIENLGLPLFNLPGNHDLKGAEGTAHYHRYLGPDYYSFNYAGVHFVLINGEYTSDHEDQAPLATYVATGALPAETPDLLAVQHRWIVEDLAAAPRDATVIFATHFLPSPGMLRYYSKLGASAVLSGHWHGHRVGTSEGVLDVNSPPLRFGGIDRHPRSFRVVEIADGRLSNELRLGGFRHHAAIVSADVVQNINGATVSVLVNAYDSRTEVEGVSCELAGRTISLRRTGAWTWTGEASLPDTANGPQTIVATVRAANGESWRCDRSFEIAAVAPQLRLKWAAQTGGFMGISSPRIGRDNIVVGVDATDLGACGVAAFASDGSRRWFFNTDSGIKNNVAAAGGRVFAMSVTGSLYALDEASGGLLWKTELKSDRARWETAATVVHDGIVHVGSISNVAAVDAATGRVLWTTNTRRDDDWWPSSYSAPVVAHDRVLLSNLRYGAWALDSCSGTPVWSREGGFSGFAVDDHVLLTVQDGHPAALDIDTGETLWIGTETLEANASKPVRSGDRIIIGTADGKVCAFSIKDGAVLWRYQTGPSLTSLEPYRRGGSDVNSSPVVDGGTIYVGASDGVLHAISADDGHAVARFALGVPIGSSPAIAGNTLYIGAYDGNVYAFSLRD